MSVISPPITAFESQITFPCPCPAYGLIKIGNVRLRSSARIIALRRQRLTGKAVAVMVSAETFDELQAVRRAAPQKAVDDGMADIKAGNIVDGDEVFPD